MSPGFREAVNLRCLVDFDFDSDRDSDVDSDADQRWSCEGVALIFEYDNVYAYEGVGRFTF